MGRMSNLVEIKNLYFRRDSGRLIFSDINIAIARGKVTAIMGPSGTGKTTLLNLIGGLVRPTRGQIRVDGLNVPELSRAELFHLRKRMGMLFQSSALFTNISVFDNVAYPLREHTPLSERLIRTLVLMKLEAVGLRGARDLMPNELSGGMARRVGLARTIALDPALVMYDEPFAGQDPISMGVLLKLIRSLNDALGLTSIIVSHDISETLSIADYAYVVADAQVIAQGAPRELYESNQPNVQQFFHGLPDGTVPFHYPAPSLAADFLGDV